MNSRLSPFIAALIIVFAVLTGSADDKPLFTFVVIGDTGCGCDAQEELAERLNEWHTEHPFDTVLMVGDNIYGKAFSARGGDRRLFKDRFDRYYRTLMDRGVKFYAALGNHDLETNDGRDEIADRARFNIINPLGYYSFTPDVSHEGAPVISFFALNSPALLATGEGDPEQVAWLSKALNESAARWEIVYLHHPIYAPEGAHDPNPRLKDYIEKVMSAAGVRIVFAGHNHYYARMLPQENIVHFITGGGGRSLKTPRKTDETAEAIKEYHFMYLEVYPENINFWVIPPSGPPIDQGAIARQVP